ncbi:MAG: lipopolysaccharide biosynthesis protein [Planctomycetes bacterium]|nr:lipopolysaccharide biosynthesis protein [Planctomycetota bacterium]
MSMKHLTRSSMLYSVGGIAMRAVGFLMIPVYTRFLTPEDYGILELIELVTVISSITFGLMAIGGAMTRIYFEREDPEWRKRVVSSAIFGAAAMSAALAVVGILFSSAIAGWLFDDAGRAHFIQATFASLFTGLLVEVSLIYLRIRDEPGRFIIISVTQLILTLLLNILLIVGLRWGVWGFLVSKMVVTSIGCVYMLTHVLRRVGVGWSGEAVRKMIAFGTPLILNGLSVFVVHFSDRFFIKEYVTLAQLGIYGLAYKFGFLISDLVGAPFQRAWAARFYEFAEKPGWEKRFMDVLLWLAFAVMVAWTGLAIFVDELFRIMTTPSFQVAALFVPAIAMGYVARTLGEFLGDLLYIKKQSMRRAKIMTASAVVNLALNAALIPAYGVWGAAWATLLTWTFFLLVAGVLARRTYPIPVPFGPLALLFGLSCGGYALSRAVVIDVAAIRWMLKAAILAAVIAGTYLLGYFRGEQRAVFEEGFGRILRALRLRLGMTGGAGEGPRPD